MLSIPFVGKLRSKILEERGYDLEKLKNATPEELGKLVGFSEKIAKKIIKYAKMVDKNYEIPEELIFEEFRCPKCGAIVSEAEPVCHNCGHEFFPPPPDMDDALDSLAEVVVELYKNPKDATLWRKGEKLLNKLGDEQKASDFKFRASALELEALEEEEKEKEGISKVSKVAAAPKSIHEGKINGLVNGSGVPVRKEEPKGRVLKAVAVFMIIIIPVIFASYLTFGNSPPVVIDGNFGEWKNVPSLTLLPGFFEDFKVKNYDGNSYMYLRASHLFSNRTQQYFSILIDSDSNPNTGYPVNSLGVDFAIMIHGEYGAVTGDMWKYDNGSWSKWGKVDIACNNNQMEMKTMRIGDNAKILLYYLDSEEHYSSVLTMKPHLWLMYQGGKVLSEGDEVENITLWNSNMGDITINKINVKNAGNATADVRISIGGFQKEITISQKNTTVNFNSPLKISKPTVMHITYISGGSKFSTLKPVIYPDSPFSSVDISSGSYIGAIPKSKSIDGIFLDWQNAHESPKGKVPLNIDLKRYGDDSTGNVKIYLSVYGTLFGIGAPEIKIAGGNGTGGNETQNVSLPKDTIEIYVDSDKNPGTGYRIGNIGAEYKILLSGNLGKVKKREAFLWQSGHWVKKSIEISDAKNSNSIEIGLGLKGNVYYRLVNFEGVWDEIPRGKIFKSMMNANATDDSSFSHYNTTNRRIIPKFLGKYNNSYLKALFGADVQVTTSNYDETRPSITRTSDGTLWVAFDYEFSSADHDVAFANSTDGGATWSVYYLESTSANTPNPIIVSDSQDNVYVFFENHTSGSYFKYFEYEGSGWYVYYLSAYTWWGLVYNISAEVYTDVSNVYIYLFFEYAYSSTDYDIGYLKSTDGGSSWWNYSDSIGSRGYWDGHPSISISTGSNPEVFLAFQNYSSSGKWCITVLNNSNINSTSWSGYYFMPAYDIALTDPSIFATGNDIYFVAQDEYQANDHDIMLWNSTDNGLTWNWGSWINSTNDDELYPSVVADGANVYVFFLDATTGRVCEKESTDYGVHWGGVNIVSDTSSGVAIYRTISSYYYSGSLYVVWTDNRNGNDDIYFDKVPEFNMAIFPLVITFAAIIMWERRKRFK